MAARRAAQELTELTQLKFETISRVAAAEDGWLVAVELLERRAIPDSADILASYEALTDPAGAVQTYERVRRYRRSDVGG